MLAKGTGRATLASTGRATLARTGRATLARTGRATLASTGRATLATREVRQTGIMYAFCVTILLLSSFFRKHAVEITLYH